MVEGRFIEGLEYVGSFGVDSGQVMVGDPCYLDEWKSNRNDEWNLEGKVGQYSYQGASATTLTDLSSGELGIGNAVVFSTGYGDGLYPVYALINDEGRIEKVVIDFVGDSYNEDEE